jgi:adenosylcobinamide-GDP ribazoletransferase
VSGLVAAVTLLTRIPIGHRGPGDIRRSVKWIPVVGGFIGLGVAGAYAGLVQVMPLTVAAGLAVTFGIVVTGAFHEDGLADTVDGFGGGLDVEDKLRIMDDPLQGTFGTLALVVSVVLRVTALAAIGPLPALVVLPATHALSRGGAIVLIGLLPPATSGGLGAAYAQPGVGRQIAVGVMSAMVIGLVTLGALVVPFALLAAIGAAVVGSLARSQISGFTGDVLGAAQQVGEISLLVLGAALAGSGALEPLWWR